MTRDKIKNKSKKKLTLKEKLQNKNDEILELTQKLTELKEKNIKLLAEFDNFQRRTIEEKEKMRKYEGLDIIKDLLPIFDDLDRFKDYNDMDNAQPILEAIEMIDSKKKNILEKHSIKLFESLNMKFNPTIHEALLEQYSDLVDKGNILEEYEKGYTYNEKIIRHAKVVVGAWE